MQINNMPSKILDGVEIGMAVRSPESKRLGDLVRRIADGTPPASSAKESTALWRAWKAGDKRAINAYIKQNVRLFYETTLKLSQVYYRLPIEDIFSVILSYAPTAFEDYDPSKNAELVSFHMIYSQYSVSHMSCKLTKISHAKKEKYLKALAVSQKTGQDFKMCLVEVIKNSRGKNAVGSADIVSYAEAMINNFRGTTSLNRKLGFERDSIEVVDILSSGPPKIELEIEEDSRRAKLEHVKSKLLACLRPKDLAVFNILARGGADSTIAAELGITKSNAVSKRKYVLDKLKRKAEELKAKGIKLPDVF